VPLRTMVVGYRVTHRPGSLVLKLLFGTLGAVVAALFLRFHGAAGRGGRLHAKRSTDEGGRLPHTHMPARAIRSAGSGANRPGRPISGGGGGRRVGPAANRRGGRTGGPDGRI
jgi:hypothetical protein